MSRPGLEQAPQWALAPGPAQVPGDLPWARPVPQEAQPPSHTTWVSPTPSSGPSSVSTASAAPSSGGLGAPATWAVASIAVPPATAPLPLAGLPPGPTTAHWPAADTTPAQAPASASEYARAPPPWSTLVQQHAAAYAAVQAVTLPPLQPAPGDPPLPSAVGGPTAGQGGDSRDGGWGGGREAGGSGQGAIVGQGGSGAAESAAASGPFGALPARARPPLAPSPPSESGEAPGVWSPSTAPWGLPPPPLSQLPPPQPSPPYPSPPAATTPSSPYTLAGVPPLAPAVWAAPPSAPSTQGPTVTSRRLAALAALQQLSPPPNVPGPSPAEGSPAWLTMLYRDALGAPHGGAFAPASTKASEVLQAMQGRAAQRQRLAQMLQL